MEETDICCIRIILFIAKECNYSIDISSLKVFIIRIYNGMNYSFLLEKVLKCLAIVCRKPRIFSYENIIPGFIYKAKR